MKNLLSVSDLSKGEILDLFFLTKKIKKQKFNNKLRNKDLALIFQKPSTRTRVSFEVGINQLGGNSLILNWNDLQLGRGETVEDTAKVFGLYVDAIIARVYEHEDLVKMTKTANIPIINSLSNLEHPCQILGDLFTIYEHFKKLNSLKLAYVGDGNNVCNSLLLGCAILGLDLSVACPKGYEPDKDIIKKAKFLSKSKIEIINDPKKAVKNANIIYTDVWVSMHQENERKKRLKIFKEYQINNSLLKKANKDAMVMHCLPAHRGQEITSDIVDGSQSLIWKQAGNRLHIQKAILLRALK